jgi:hypothetical protein
MINKFGPMWALFPSKHRSGRKPWRLIVNALNDAPELPTWSIASLNIAGI